MAYNKIINQLKSSIMKRSLVLAAGAVLVAASVSAFVYVNNERNSMSDLFNANVEALANGEGHDYSNAKNVYCIVPAGQIGCESALFRQCTAGVFCNDAR